MMATKRIVACGVVALLLAACSETPREPTLTAVPQATVGGVPGENPQARPFAGTMPGVVHWELTTVCAYQPVLTLTDGMGEVTHLGRALFTGRHCASADGQAALDGEITFTAANGDKLFATYTGQVVAPPPAEAGCAGVPMCFAEEGIGTITGGTGRFAHATGSLTFTIGVYPTEMPPTLESQWPVLFVMRGTVTY